jgi:hypothetical protein
MLVPMTGSQRSRHEILDVLLPQRTPRNSNFLHLRSWPHHAARLVRDSVTKLSDLQLASDTAAESENVTGSCLPSRHCQHQYGNGFPEAVCKGYSGASQCYGRMAAYACCEVLEWQIHNDQLGCGKETTGSCVEGSVEGQASWGFCEGRVCQVG